MACTRRAISCFVVPLVALTIAAASASAQKMVRQIEVTSSWGGLGGSQQSQLLIREQAGNFYIDGVRLDPTLVEKLVAALTAPTLSEPAIGNLGLTTAWVERITLTTVPADTRFREAAPNQRALLTASLEDSDIVSAVASSLFRLIRFDDYPRSSIKVVFSDGSTLSSHSDSANAFMLPWKVGDDEVITFNANISRALAALLPDGALNRDRLVGEDFDKAVLDGIMRRIEPEWNLLDAENRFGPELAVLRRRYAIQSASVNSYHNVEYGIEWSRKGPRETNLHTSLRKPGSPPNIATALVLESRDDKLVGLDGFLNSAGQYEDLVLSVPWLNEYLHAHPNESLSISFVHDASFSAKALQTFTRDMHERRRDDLIPEVRTARSEIALVMIGRAYWLVYPDHRMLLWRYDGPAGLLRWTQNDFPPGRCAEYHPSSGGGCVGLLVSPAGELLKRRSNADESCVASFLSNRSAPPDNEGPLFPVHDQDRGGFINQTGEIVIPLCFDTVGDFSEGLAPFERDGLWGFIDQSGTVAIEPQFKDAWGFSDGLARVQVNGLRGGFNARWGFIDKGGGMVIQRISETLQGVSDADQGFREGLAMIQQNYLLGFIDRSGNVVVKPQFRYAYHFSEGLAAVCTEDGSLWGYIDATGTWAIPPQFNWASLFSEGLAPVDRDGTCGYIDQTGAFALVPSMPKGEKDCAVVWGHFVEGLSRWKIGNRYGYIDPTGKVIVKPTLELTDQFSEGLARVMVGDKWGYIDRSGRMTIRPRKFRRVDDFNNGLANVVTLDGNWGYICRSGEYVWQPTR